ncbi:MAG: hypothetical protein DWQ10_17820 [Calditrichaeota bacterium]|nr:MAG: hypothetical protein DWQ10_17820 [Calditrichota bacterium]
MRYFTLFLLIFLFIACDKRERSNPLDPRNPDSKGKPEPPAIFSTHDSVHVSWSHLNFSNANAYNIYRKIEGEDDFQFIKSLQPHIFSYWDTNCEYEKSRWYKISVSSEGFESILSDQVEIRPGPSFLWATDRFNGMLTKYSHDGRHVVFRTTDFIEPYRLKTSPNLNFIWISDLWEGRIKRISTNGTLINDKIQLLGLTDFVFDPLDEVVWVSSYNFNTCARFNFAGLKELEISLFKSPWYLALHTGANRVFVVNDGLGEIIRMNYEGQIEKRKDGFENFKAMAYDEKRDRLWVSDLDRITILEQNLGEMNIYKRLTGFSRIGAFAIDHERGDVWCFDFLQQEDASRVLKFSADGDEMLVLNGFTDPRALAVNPANNNCFVAEGVTGKIVELDDESGATLGVNVTNREFSKIAVQH